MAPKALEALFLEGNIYMVTFQDEDEPTIQGITAVAGPLSIASVAFALATGECQGLSKRRAAWAREQQGWHFGGIGRLPLPQGETSHSAKILEVK